MAHTEDKSPGWLNLRSLEVFVTIVEAEGMTSAARRLGLTQSAISQTLMTLEANVGARLFDRGVRPPKLTLIGTNLYRRAADLLSRAREVEQLVDLEANKSLALLQIGMIDSFAATVGPGLLRELGNIATQWSVRSGISATSAKALEERQVDFMITSDPSHKAMTESDILAIPIAEERYLIVAPRDTSDEHRTFDDWAEHLPLIRYSDRSFIGLQIDEYLCERATSLRYQYKLDTSDAVLAMVHAGFGWTITSPLCFLKSRPAKEAVRCIPLEPALTRRIWLLARRSESSELAERIATTARDVLERVWRPSIDALYDGDR